MKEIHSWFQGNCQAINIGAAGAGGLKTNVVCPGLERGGGGKGLPACPAAGTDEGQGLGDDLAVDLELQRATTTSQGIAEREFVFTRNIGLNQPVEVFAGAGLEINKAFACVAAIVFGHAGTVSTGIFRFEDLFDLFESSYV